MFRRISLAIQYVWQRFLPIYSNEKGPKAMYNTKTLGRSVGGVNGQKALGIQLLMQSNITRMKTQFFSKFEGKTLALW